MSSALIGYTGFVGGNIYKNHSFDHLFNSKNIDSIDNQSFDLVVSAGVSAVKWLANKEPETDLQNIQSFVAHLKTITAKKFVLISTVDVYPKALQVDEDTPINADKCEPYGKHRLQLEKTISYLFPNVTIVRLPALFGHGLKKNLIFDLIHNRMLDYTHPDSTFPFYNLANIWHDIEVAVAHNIPVVNFATEPLRASDIADAIGIKLTPKPEAKVIAYDMYTKYASLFGAQGHYLYDKKTMLKEVVAFINSEKAKLT